MFKTKWVKRMKEKVDALDEATQKKIKEYADKVFKAAPVKKNTAFEDFMTEEGLEDDTSYQGYSPPPQDYYSPIMGSTGAAIIYGSGGKVGMSESHLEGVDPSPKVVTFGNSGYQSGDYVMGDLRGSPYGLKVFGRVISVGPKSLIVENYGSGLYNEVEIAHSKKIEEKQAGQYFDAVTNFNTTQKKMYEKKNAGSIISKKLPYNSFTVSNPYELDKKNALPTNKFNDFLPPPNCVDVYLLCCQTQSDRMDYIPIIFLDRGSASEFSAQYVLACKGGRFEILSIKDLYREYKLIDRVSTNAHFSLFHTSTKGDIKLIHTAEAKENNFFSYTQTFKNVFVDKKAQDEGGPISYRIKEEIRKMVADYNMIKDGIILNGLEVKFSKHGEALEGTIIEVDMPANFGFSKILATNGETYIIRNSELTFKA